MTPEERVARMSPQRLLGAAMRTDADIEAEQPHLRGEDYALRRAAQARLFAAAEAQTGNGTALGALSPGQDVTVVYLGMNAPGRVREVIDAEGFDQLVYEVDYAIDGQFRTARFFSSDLVAR